MYPQANGEIERAIRTVKSLLKKCRDKAEDPYPTPLARGYIPAELQMGRFI